MRKKLTLLFTLLCVGMMGWADTGMFVPGNAAILKATGQLENHAQYNSSTGTITGTVQTYAGWQWGAQIHLTHGVSFTAGKQYTFSCDITTSNAVNNITIKLCDAQERLYKTDFKTEASVANTYSGTFTAVGDETSAIVFDFGFAAANTDITISNISIVEREADPSANWWESASYVGSALGATYANKYKMIAESGVSIVNIQGDPASIYVITDTDLGLTCSLPSAEYHAGGAALFLHLSAFTDQETEFTITNNNGTYTCKVYYVDGVAGGAANPHLTLTNPSKSTVLLPKGETITVAYTSDNNATAAITSSQPTIASVSGNAVTAEATGTATITVSQAEVADTWQAASKTFEVNAFDWDDVAFIATSDYKFKASSNSVTLDNAIITWHENNCIHLILPDAVDLGCSLAGYYETEGAGMFINVEAFTTRQTPFTVSCHGIVYDCYVYYNLDETAPVISDVTVSSYNHEKAVLAITTNEAFVTAEVFNNNFFIGTFTPTGGAITITGLTASTPYNQLTVKVKDAAGNWSDAANVPEFTTLDAPTISPATYYGYSTQKGVYALYSITRNPDMSVTFSVKVDAAFSFNKRLHYYKGGVADVWVDLVYNSGTDTYDYTADAGLFIDGEEWVAEFYFPFTGDAASIVCNYTVGSEQAQPESIPAGAVVLNKTTNSLTIGETDNLTATVYPSFATNAGTVSWASDAEDYATVNATGTVTAVAAGTANITATCGDVTSAPCVVTVAASLEEAKFYGCGAFVNNAGVVVSYDYVFTRATNHQVTLDVVFSRSMNGIIGSDNFQIYINSANQHMVYDDATQTATYAFGEQTESSSINYYFYFVLDGGGVHQIQQTAYIVGSTNDAAHAFAIGENETNNVAALAAADGQTFDKVFVARSFEADNLYTLVLPFNADAAQTAEKLPGKLTKLNNTIVKENEDLRINFVDAEAIEAGVPYLYTPSANIANPVFTGVTVSEDLNPSVADPMAKYYGIYAPTTGTWLKTQTHAYVLGSDQYLYAASVLQDDQPMKALRGYFVLNFPSGANGAPRAKVIFNSHETETTTNVSNVQSDNIQCTKVIRDGQLLIIRDGRTYDAQGQVIK